MKNKMSLREQGKMSLREVGRCKSLEEQKSAQKVLEEREPIIPKIHNSGGSLWRYWVLSTKA
jgi:hypothetical protein